MKETNKEILNKYKQEPCYFCGKFTEEDEDFVLFGTEAHENNPRVKIIKSCTWCEYDWISTYRR